MTYRPAPPPAPDAKTSYGESAQTDSDTEQVQSKDSPKVTLKDNISVNMESPHTKSSAPFESKRIVVPREDQDEDILDNHDYLKGMGDQSDVVADRNHMVHEKGSDTYMSSKVESAIHGDCTAIGQITISNIEFQVDDMTMPQAVFHSIFSCLQKTFLLFQASQQLSNRCHQCPLIELHPSLSKAFQATNENINEPFADHLSGSRMSQTLNEFKSIIVLNRPYLPSNTKAR